MSRGKSILIIATVLLILVSACGPQQVPAGDNGGDQDPTSAIETRVAEIVASTDAAQTAIANAVAATLAGMETSTPESTFTPLFTFTPSLTPTPTFTLTPEFPTVSVSVDTNCRAGPGSAYDMIGGLAVGQTAEVIGRDAYSQYWIIKNPVNTGSCWLWGKYATVVGNTQGLPVIAAPPTPTPIPAVTNVAILLGLTYKSSCESVIQFTVTITTNGPFTVNYVVKAYFEGVEHRSTLYAKNFTSAGTQSFIDAFHELDCGTWGYKVIVTSPNSMTAEAIYKVIP